MALTVLLDILAAAFASLPWREESSGAPKTASTSESESAEAALQSFGAAEQLGASADNGIQPGDF
eukprot:1591660-Prorocentrum_lima.AAC.1